MQMDLIKDIQKYVHKDLTEVNELIINSLAVREELIGLVATYLMEAGGKRIRPILTILASNLFSYTGKNHILLASAIEFIHAATLLHDDVVDGSQVRRFKPTANIVWGNNTSILVGDFLFSQSFRLMVQTKLIPALEVLSHASSVIIEGEVSQLAKLNQKRIISLNEYYEIIDSKTAVLFGAACEVGAILGEQSTEIRQNLNQFGANLGIIFQIIDDWLDYFGTKDQLGKPVGSDFFEGKATMPLILLHSSLTGDKQERLGQIMKLPTRSEEDFTWVKDLLASNKFVKNQIDDKLNQLKNAAKKLLKDIEGNQQCKDYMIELVEFAMNRSY